jgi:hypothetical protein
MTLPTKILALGPDAVTLLTIVKGELTNWGYKVSEPHYEYDPNWGDGQLTIEIESGDS